MKTYLFTLILFLTGCSQLPTKRTDRYSILQGVTNTKEVEFSVLGTKGIDPRFELRSDDGEVLAPDEVRVISRDFSKYVIHKLLFTRTPGHDYNLYVYEGEKLVDQRLVGRGQREVSKLRLGVASCMSDFFGKHEKIWSALSKKNPEYMLMIGDNVYADASSSTTTQVTDPEVLWKRYVETRLALPYFFQEKLIPTHALWDDHDFGVNDGNRSFKHKEASREIFEAFFAQDLSDDDWSRGPGVGGLLSLGDFNLYFLDGRYFRSEDPQGKHLGLEQTAWFYSKLRDEATPSFIIKGDQFFGGYHSYESFQGRHPDDFDQFVTELKGISTPFIFLSGDRHMSEIMQFPRSLFGRPSFEITSSPIQGKTFSTEDSNPWRVVSQKSKVNFTVIDSVAVDNHWFMEVENIGENGETYFKRELAVYIKDLQNNLNEVRKRRYGKRRYRQVKPRRGRRR